MLNKHCLCYPGPEFQVAAEFFIQKDASSQILSRCLKLINNSTLEKSATWLYKTKGGWGGGGSGLQGPFIQCIQKTSVLEEDGFPQVEQKLQKSIFMYIYGWPISMVNLFVWMAYFCS